MLLAAASLIPTLGTAASATQPVTLWGNAAPAHVAVDHDRGSVELGTVFVPNVDGRISGVRFWKTPANRGVHTGHLWGPGGRLLATATFGHESSHGWETVEFDEPIVVTAGMQYVVSYHAPHGRYAETTDFSGQSDTRLLSVPRGASGVYAYGSSVRFPHNTWQNAQYWVDVLFFPSGQRSSGATPSSGVTGTASPTKAPTFPPTPTATPTPTPTHGKSSTPKPTAAPSPSAGVTPSPTPSRTGPGGTALDPAPPTGVRAQASVGTGWNITPATIGLAASGLSCSKLPVYGRSDHVIPAGTVIDKQRLTTWYDLSAGNITIKNSCVQPTPGSIGQGSFALSTWGKTPGGPVTIEDSEYDGSLLSRHDAAWIGMFTGVANFYRNYIHDSGSGLVIYGSAEKTGSDVVVQNNYVDDLIADGDASTSGNHESAMTVRDFDTRVNPNRQLLIRDNYFNCDGENATGALFIQPNDGDVKNVTVQGNLLAGYGFQFYLDYQPQNFPGVGYANIRAVDNRLDETHAGAVFVRDGGPGVAVWQDNYTYDMRGDDGRGRLVGNPNP
jgi:hypothetical protein